MGSRQSFHVTGESCRASGYGEPAGQYLPTPGPCAWAPPLVVPGFVHASRIAAPGSARDAAAADLLRISLLVMPSGHVGRSLGCLAIAAHTLSPMSGPLGPQTLTGESTGIFVPLPLLPQPYDAQRDRSATLLVTWPLRSLVPDCHRSARLGRRSR